MVFIYAEYNRPVDFFNLLDNKKCFLRKPDDKLVKFIREYFKNPEQDLKWFTSFKKFIEKEYINFIVSQSIFMDKETIPQPSDNKGVSGTKFKVSSRDYLVKIYTYDTRFGEKCIMCGEQIISIALSDNTLVLTVNTTFIDYEVLHSSEEELEQRSLDFIRADINGEIMYLDEDGTDF